MRRLPLDVQQNLRDKFSNVPELDSIINSVFDAICEKTFNDGSCSVQRFGTFYCYKAFSSKKGKFVPRFKFRISRTFQNSISDDEYTLQRIENVVNRNFAEEKKENKIYDHVRSVNQENQNKILNNQRKVREKGKENLIRDEIAKILEKE